MLTVFRYAQTYKSGILPSDFFTTGGACVPQNCHLLSPKKKNHVGTIFWNQFFSFLRIIKPSPALSITTEHNAKRGLSNIHAFADQTVKGQGENQQTKEQIKFLLGAPYPRSKLRGITGAPARPLLGRPQKLEDFKLWTIQEIHLCLQPQQSCGVLNCIGSA